MNPAITFDESAKKYVLDIFGKAVDAEGFIVERNDHNQKVLTPRGEEINLSEFAGVHRGSAVLMKSDIVSLVEAAEAMSRK